MSDVIDVKDQDTNEFLELFADEVRSATKGERTRLKIMASAAKVFNDKGFSDASIQDIADDAGIAKGTIYYYVDKKEDLLVMLLKFGKARLFTKLERSLAKAGTASEKVEALIRTHLRLVKTVGPIMPFFIQNIVSEDSRVRETMGGVRSEYLNLLAGIIREGTESGEFRPVDARKTAVAIVGMVIGQLMQHKVFNGKINTKEIADSTLDIVLSGLRSKNEG